jgi:hypothetical protein
MPPRRPEGQGLFPGSVSRGIIHPRGKPMRLDELTTCLARQAEAIRNRVQE